MAPNDGDDAGASGPGVDAATAGFSDRYLESPSLQSLRPLPGVAVAAVTEGACGRLLLKVLRLLRGLPRGLLRLLCGWTPGQRGIRREGQWPHRRAATLRTAGSVRKGGGSGALKLEALHRAHVRRIARFFIGFFRWSEIEVWDYHDFNWANDLLLLLSRICCCCFC